MAAEGGTFAEALSLEHLRELAAAALARAGRLSRGHAPGHPGDNGASAGEASRPTCAPPGARRGARAALPGARLRLHGGGAFMLC